MLLVGPSFILYGSLLECLLFFLVENNFIRKAFISLTVMISSASEGEET